MASKVSGIVEQIQTGGSGGTKYAIASTAYGYCETSANQPAKTVDMDGFKLNEGVTIHVKFKNSNTASNPTLNVESTGAKPIVQYGATAVSTTDETSGWYAGAILTLTYDGTSWVRDQGFNSNTWNALSTSQAGYVSQAPNDTTKFLRGDANWSALPTASTSAAGIIQIGTNATNAAAGNHNHGNITNDGCITTTITKDKDDYIIIGDNSDSGKIGKGPVFSSAISTQTASSKFLREDGSWSATTPAVKQSASTTERWRKVLLHYKDDDAINTAVTDSTNQVYAAVDISVQPKTGTLAANKYVVDKKVRIEYNSTVKSLDFILI